VRGLQQEIDRLFALPLNEFTSARNELARRLRNEGESAAADEIRALGKPTVSAWAINQLSRCEPAAVGDLLRAGDALRKEQQRLLREAGKPDSLRDALAKERKAISALTEGARSVLEKEGRPVTEATLQRIAGTLQAAAVENVGRQLLKAGRLTGDLEPTGFEAFAGVELPARRSGSAPAHDELSDRRRQKEEHQRRVSEAQQQVRDLEEAAREAESGAKLAARAAAEAQREAERARRAADDAAAELADLRQSGPRGARPSR